MPVRSTLALAALAVAALTPPTLAQTTPHVDGLTSPSSRIQLADTLTAVVVAENLNGPLGLIASTVQSGGFVVAESNEGLVTGVNPNGSRESISGFGQPFGLSLAGPNELVATDRGAGTVQYANSNGVFAVVDGFLTPTDIIVDDGGFYVTETDGNRVTLVTVDGSGNRVRKTFADGLGSPYGLAFAADGRVLVTEFAAGRVVAIDADGTVAVVAEGLDRPAGIIGLADGRALVVEQGAGRVVAVGGAGPPETIVIGLVTPTFIDVSPVDGRAYVSEVSQNRVVAFGEFERVVGGGATAAEGGPEAASRLAVSPNPSAGPARAAFTLEAAGDVEVSVFDALGRRVAVVAEGARAAGAHEVSLDVRGLPAGVYVVRLRAGGAVSARSLTVVR